MAAKKAAGKKSANEEGGIKRKEAEMCLLYMPVVATSLTFVFYSPVFSRVINKLQPGSVKKINRSALNWHQVCILGRE